LVLFVCACSTSNAPPPDGACGRYYDAHDAFVRSCLLAGSAARVLGPRETFLRSCAIGQRAAGMGANTRFLLRCAETLEWHVPECPGLSLAGVTECMLPAGALAKGAACLLSAQCESRNCTTGTQAGSGAQALAACGVCGESVSAPSAPQPTVPAMVSGVEGSVCALQDLFVGGFETYTCGPGLYCDLVYVFETGTQGGSCKRLPEFGEACTSVCAGALVCLRGVCQTGQAVGTGSPSPTCSPESCGIFSTCADNRCQSFDANLCK
jgi:hypothetical protein